MGERRHGENRARVFLNQRAEAKAVTIADSGFTPDNAVQIRGNAGLFVDGAVPDGKADTLTMMYDGIPSTLPLSQARSELLSGQDCLLSTLNQALSVPANNDDRALNPLADPKYICGWLAHHA